MAVWQEGVSAQHIEAGAEPAAGADFALPHSGSREGRCPQRLTMHALSRLILIEAHISGSG